MRVYTHPACLAHQPGPGHPESPARLATVLEALRAAFPDLDWREAPPARREQLARAHSPALLARVLDARPTAWPHRLDEDTLMSADSAEAALRAAGAVVAAVDAVLAGEVAQAFCAVRPPGHHATRDTPMGFCLLNGVAVGAVHALEAHGLARVAVVDFDVHHGNGTEDIALREPRLQYVSSHQAPLYPGTGLEDHGARVLNAPLPPRCPGLAFRETWRERLLPAIDRFAPQLILVSAGFDGHRLDPLADLELGPEDYRWLSAELAALARRHCGGRLVSVLEGGYSLTALRECSVAHLRGLQAA
ncbi:MAG: acetoin utilization protein [Silanimonas sp.]|nr:MAG: acetoin utilization protein [Silanimonas sp.]